MSEQKQANQSVVVSNSQQNFNEEYLNQSKFQDNQKPTTSVSDCQKLDSSDKMPLKQKEQIQRTLAKQFITTGFGFGIGMKAVRKHHKLIINSPIYNNFLTTVVRKAFRILQYFLINECKLEHIKPLSYYESTLIRSPMIQCAKWLVKDELNTFYKFIIRAYNLKKVYITEDQAYRLYGQLIQSAGQQHEVSHIILHRQRKKALDPRSRDGLKFSYVPSTVISSNRW